MSNEVVLSSTEVNRANFHASKKNILIHSFQTLKTFSRLKIFTIVTKKKLFVTRLTFDQSDRHLRDEKGILV